MLTHSAVPSESLILPTIKEWDLSKTRAQLMHPEFGHGWSAQQADVAIYWYRRYLTLCHRFPTEQFAEFQHELSAAIRQTL